MVVDSSGSVSSVSASSRPASLSPDAHPGRTAQRPPLASRTSSSATRHSWWDEPRHSEVMAAIREATGRSDPPRVAPPAPKRSESHWREPRHSEMMAALREAVGGSQPACATPPAPSGPATGTRKGSLLDRLRAFGRPKSGKAACVPAAAAPPPSQEAKADTRVRFWPRPSRDVRDSDVLREIEALRSRPDGAIVPPAGDRGNKRVRKVAVPRNPTAACVDGADAPNVHHAREGIATDRSGPKVATQALRRLAARWRELRTSRTDR